ncbi:MAG: type II toxin-antitoxin system VapC family toxin [Gemmatimonadota bacterium]|nr:type II toxin-antitoxin system VapC family toxin [Gemmatimonadota bacterium]
MRYFDASAVVKRYVDEAGSARIRRLLVPGEVIVSRLSEVEVASSMSRRAREGALSAEQRDRMLTSFLEDLATWQVVEVTRDVTTAARRLVRNHPLRAADAVQLASALVVEGHLRQALAEFVAFDRRLLDAARAEHLTVSPQ